MSTFYYGRDDKIKIGDDEYELMSWPPKFTPPKSSMNPELKENLLAIKEFMLKWGLDLEAETIDQAIAELEKDKQVGTINLSAGRRLPDVIIDHPPNGFTTIKEAGVREVRGPMTDFGSDRIDYEITISTYGAIYRDYRNPRT